MLINTPLFIFPSYVSATCHEKWSNNKTCIYGYSNFPALFRTSTCVKNLRFYLYCSLHMCIFLILENTFEKCTDFRPESHLNQHGQNYPVRRYMNIYIMHATHICNTLWHTSNMRGIRFLAVNIIEITSKSLKSVNQFQKSWQYLFSIFQPPSSF